MKKRNLFQLFTAAFALMFAGCSHNELADVSPGMDDFGGNNSKDAVYMNVMVQLPTGSGKRSTTDENGQSSGGTEVGNNDENKISSVLLVLAQTDNKFIGCAEKSEGIPEENKTTGYVTAVQSISKSVLSAYYGEDGTLTADEQKINVFVFCNPTDALKRIFTGVSKGDETWHEQICSISEEPNGTSDNAAIWGGSDHTGGFLMSSYEIAEKRLPANFSDWDKFTTLENPFKLSGTNTGLNGSGMEGGTIENGGAIKVERSVARFDFKDGSPEGNNTYNVIYDDPEATDRNCLVQIQLTKMALVNMSKNFYYLRRVSDNGLSSGNQYKLCGTETSTNYVVDTDASEKNAGDFKANNKYANHFNFCLGNPENNWNIDAEARTQWFTTEISQVLNGTEDNPDWTVNQGDYRIWRYVTENTIPGETSNQTNGISTGIVFKGKMVATNFDTNSSLYKALTAEGELSDEDPILYAYGSDLFVRWTEVREMAIKQGINSPMYKAVFGNTTVTPVAAKPAGEDDTPAVEAVYSNDPDSPDAKWNAWYNEGKASNAKQAFKSAATETGFTLYERSHDPQQGYGYYCYYFYWNRHNDNGNPGVMGPMEFAVVRNNVYKLAVTNISRLGHPRISENDPDPIDPEDPDEEGDVYLSVSVEVLPWVVRVNNIIF